MATKIILADKTTIECVTSYLVKHCGPVQPGTEELDMTLVNVASAIEAAEGGVRVTRPTPDGDEVVETDVPAVVTISNELGEPRYPTTAQTIKARRTKPKVVTLEELSLGAADLAPRAKIIKQFVPEVQGNCEFIDGDSPAELAANLLARLRAENVPSYVDIQRTVPWFPAPQGYRVLVDAQMEHRARWLIAQSVFSDAQLGYLATGEFPERSK